MAVRERYRTRVPLQKDTIKTLKVKNEMRPIDAKAEIKKNVLIAQEIKMARLLANNDKRIRDKVLKRLKKWLSVRSQSSFAFTKTDFMSLWKGLFYCMWMSDKMLIQEELAESLSKLVHCFNSKDTILLYTSCALKTLAVEWFGIDQYRLDKFLMLIRRILRQTFVICKDKSWNIKWVTELSQMFLQLFLHPKTGLGFNLHMIEIYLQELAKVSNGNIPEYVVHEFIKPFVTYLMTTDDERQMKHIMQHVFRYLIFQSDIGLDYMEKFEAWKRAGFPCTHVDSMQKIEIEDTEKNVDNANSQFLENEIQHKSEKPLDPRAGKVDMELPQIPFNAAKIVNMLSTYHFHPSSKAKSRRQLSRLIEEFKELSEGRMPLGIKKIKNSNLERRDSRKESRKATLRLIQFEKELFSDNINKKQKRKRNGEAVASDISSYDSLKNKNHLELNSIIDTIDLESESIDSIMNMKANLQDIDIDIVPHKKQKHNLTCDKFDKNVTIEDKEKLKTKAHKKFNKTKKIKLSQMNDTFMTDNNITCKPKKTVFHEKHTFNKDQSIVISPILKKKKLLKEATKKKSLVLKETLEKNVIHNDQGMHKDELSTRTKKQTNLNNSLEKKKVIFSLLRNTAQHTSEYLQQIRKSPAIPFDANKKPLASVLKTSPISSPLNPFYKNKI
ncbi:ribosomal RNA processing protein 1 homolog [Cataglyphis hispanica]|uniref:ribosomal RNA processing protein 1 homolog n=1 Tax=Cataglyphis hispanica TaxID=1086592 RepID=UPI00217F9309|nr:ribosomal RNA processing protein 1 homolog [Cataglyphis hispanica]XP_050459342.1 ribosomal RNA processing protein 1 homolog [Cataglyphis hispanica]